MFTFLPDRNMLLYMINHRSYTLKVCKTTDMLRQQHVTK